METAGEEMRGEGRMRWKGGKGEGRMRGGGGRKGKGEGRIRGGGERRARGGGENERAIEQSGEEKK